MNESVVMRPVVLSHTAPAAVVSVSAGASYLVSTTRSFRRCCLMYNCSVGSNIRHGPLTAY